MKIDVASRQGHKPLGVDGNRRAGNDLKFCLRSVSFIRLPDGQSERIRRTRKERPRHTNRGLRRQLTAGSQAAECPYLLDGSEKCLLVDSAGGSFTNQVHHEQVGTLIRICPER